jgi:hypothetical protein
MNYKEKYFKYKNKYLKLKYQKGGNLQSDFFMKYPFEKELIDSDTIKIKFMDVNYSVHFTPFDEIIFNNNERKVLVIKILNNNFFDVDYFDDGLDLLKEMLKIFNFGYARFSKKYFEDENLLRYKTTDNYFLLNEGHSNYSKIMNEFLSNKEKFYNKITLEKNKRDNKFYVKYKTKEYEILEDEKNIILHDGVEILINFKIITSCISSVVIKEYNDCKDFVDIILNIYNLSLSIYDKKICDECIDFQKNFLYLNKFHELYDSLKQVLIEDNYNSKLGISKDLLTEKMYSINFLWLRIESFTEGCFSIMGNNDKFIEMNTISNILKLQENDFFIKLINFSKNNPNALVNFWFDATQVRLETLINLRLVFDILNRHLRINLCIRDIWSSRIINEMNIKYSEILPKCSGYSLILRVDLYKCIICVEELDRHTYSIFADLDMKPIGEDEILSENNIRILNRIGLVLSKFSKIFENGFQILGSEIENTRKAVIETFNVMMIERFMIILNKMKTTDEGRYFTPDLQNEILYNGYQPMYNYLYYKCKFGILYFGFKKLIKNPTGEYILEHLSNIRLSSSEYAKEPLLKYVPYEIFNDDIDINSNNIFKEQITYQDLLNLLDKYVDLEKFKNYLKKLRAYEKILHVEEIAEADSSAEIYSDLFKECIVQTDDLILFRDTDTIPPTSGNWPFKMCKKYIKSK